MGFAGNCIGVRAFGGPEMLATFGDVKSAEAPEQIVIRNRYCGVNPVDVSFRIGRMRDYSEDLADGLVLGMECAGEVVASRSPRLPVGAVVNALTLPGAASHAGSYAEYVVADGARAAVVPYGMTGDIASAVPLNGVTASSIVDELGAAGEVVAITGAAGALGRFLVYAAGAAGLTTIAIARGSDEPLLRGLGADRVLDVATLSSEGAPPVDAIVDAASLGPALTGWFAAARTIVKVRADTEYTLPHERLIEANVRRATDVGERIGWWNRQVLRKPEIVGPIEQFAPQDVAAAHERLATRNRRGRVVLRWWEHRPFEVSHPTPRAAPGPEITHV